MFNVFLPMIMPSIVFGIVALVALLIVMYFAKRNQKSRKSPLGIKLLRLPGETLQHKIEEITLDIIGNFTLIAVMSAIMFPIFLSQKNNSTGLAFLILFLLSLLGVIIRDNYKLIIKRNALRVGLEAERAMGEYLTRLISMKKAFVFHDFYAENFNIDHILIAESGVYAIETKGRSKNTLMEKNWEVAYSINKNREDKLVFPYGEESKPLNQARS
ncbi:MAG: nuclease-related domain-containing protein, partial [Ostreibacterium sp.]